MSDPKVFISYSQDSEDHKAWVVRLATDLRNKGVDASLDKWDLMPGQDVVSFMAQGISSADRVVMICSHAYVERADGRVGGTGYEALIITAELTQTIDTKKFIPLIRSNTGSRKMPIFLGARLYLDFSSDAEYPNKLEELLREIRGLPSAAKPPIGPNPFSGTASPRPVATRLAGPSGLTASGDAVLADTWFSGHADTAQKGLTSLGLQGGMELRFALHDLISKSQLELLNAVRASEINTFGWPIGVTLENRDEYRPRPVADGIVAEVAMKAHVLSSKPSYDYWAARNNGDFYMLQSLFEDERVENAFFFDTRIVRITEALMFCSNLYTNLGVVPDARVSVRVSHRGLAGRTLTSASPHRRLFPSTTQEAVSETQIVEAVGQLRPRLVDHVMQIAEPLFMLFDFTKLDRKVYEDIVKNFLAGKIS